MEALNNIAAGVKTVLYDTPLQYRKTTGLLVGTLALAGLAYYTGNINSAGLSKLSGAAVSVLNRAVELGQTHKAGTVAVATAVALATGYVLYRCCSESVEQTRTRLQKTVEDAEVAVDRLTDRNSEKDLVTLEIELETARTAAEAENADEAAKSALDDALEAVKQKRAFNAAEAALASAKQALANFNSINSQPPTK